MILRRQYGKIVGGPGPHPGQVVESMLTEMREQLKDFEARTDTLGRRL
jgi:hypothetical protein